jgi:hypothetical protein
MKNSSKTFLHKLFFLFVFILCLTSISPELVFAVDVDIRSDGALKSGNEYYPYIAAISDCSRLTSFAVINENTQYLPLETAVHIQNTVNQYLRH